MAWWWWWRVSGGRRNVWLLLAVFIAVLTKYYSLWRSAQTDASVEQRVVYAWDELCQLPSTPFRRITIGVNCNVDLIVSGTELLSALNATGPQQQQQPANTVSSVQQLADMFAWFFSQGAATERFVSDESTWQKVVQQAEHRAGIEYAIGGNAALMAQYLATKVPHVQVLLVGAIGPRSRALLSSHILMHNSTRIANDEVHVIMEYKQVALLQGEIWEESVAPTSNRFIVSHNLFSSSAIMLDMFFNTIGSPPQPDLVILSGLHLLENQPAELYQEKMRLVRRRIGAVSRHTPVHLQLGSLSNRDFARTLLHKVMPLVDSIALNEQELTLLSSYGDGPHVQNGSVRAGTIHVHKAVDMLHWLLSRFGVDDTADGDGVGQQGPVTRLARVHFHCLTYHIMAVRGHDWSNMAAATASGALVAGQQACGLSRLDSSLLDLRVGHEFVLDTAINKVYHFDPDRPLDSWMRGDVLFVFTPALVCEHPVKTVGLGDAIAAAALSYSQFYRFGMTT